MNIRILLSFIALTALGGCTYRQDAKTSPPSVASPVQFSDVTTAAGIKFVHANGVFGERWMPETVGSGAAFFDFDNDGDQDIFLVNGREWRHEEIEAYKRGNGRRRATLIPKNLPHRIHTGTLYRNNGDGTFIDATNFSGLNIEIYGMGAAAGDYDNDGQIDLYVTSLTRNYLFHNEKGRFHEVTAPAGLEDNTWSTSAAWLDYDRDGRLDLFVGHYIKWSPATDVFASVDGKTKSYVGPISYPGQPNRLYRNLGNGKFKDASKNAGILANAGRALNGKALGVAVCDYNNDSWPDIIVANDLTPNFLFRNNANGSFSEIGAMAGLAYNEAGATRAGMGIDTADIDQSGHESVVIGNFSDEMLGLYRNNGGLFTDMAPRSLLGQASLKFLTFGVLFLDYDNDGWPDLFVANGHVDSDVARLRSDVSYRQRPLLFHNQKGEFHEVGLESGEALRREHVGRGLAAADIDLDGDVDVVMTSNGDSPTLFRNENSTGNNVIRLVLEGTRSNRSAIGTLVTASIGKNVVRRTVRSGSSYLSQSELPLTIGLGKATKADTIVISWPSGQKTRLQNIMANRAIVVNETRGIISNTALSRGVSHSSAS